MSQRVLGEFARQEIRDAIIGLRGSEARVQIASMAERYGVSKGYLYAITCDLRPKRKQRADKGVRLEELKNHPHVRLAMEKVHIGNLKPDLAIKTVVGNQLAAGHRDYKFPISPGHFRRVLRQCGISRKSERRRAIAYRPWQAKFPGEIFQVDFSGLKTRWIDRTTRRILKLSELDVSRNHPNTNPHHVGLWKFTLVDDCTRLHYSRFIACEAPNGSNVLDFLLDCFRELGIPRILYTDRDRAIRNKRFFRAESILNNAYADNGGFRHLQHAARKPNATGKVERAHQIVEEYEALLGVSDTPRTLDDLNNLSREMDLDYNWNIHRRTGRRPGELWQEFPEALRMPPPKLLDSAMKAEEFNCLITDRITIEFRHKEYQLPRERPFVDWAEARQKVFTLWPPDEEFFWLFGPDNSEHEVTRVLARADAAGEFKQLPESRRQTLSKELKAERKARRARARETGEDLLVPGLDFPLSNHRPAAMPKKKIDPSLEEWANHGRGVVSSTFVGRPLDRYAAKQCLMTEGLCSTPIAADDARWLDELFTTRELILDTELRELVAQRASATAAEEELIAVRSA